jgi:hypothetical protein
MYLTLNTGKLPLARVLALVAFLCAGAMQVQEAGHWHELDDSYSQCLVCKSSGGTALPFEAPVGIASGPVKVEATPIQRDTLPGKALPFQARGPPHNS